MPLPDAPLSWPKARIEICGPLGSGKSTLMGALEHFGCRASYEPVEQHPFLSSFYDNPQRYAFEKSAYFALDYIHTIKQLQDTPQTVVLDTGLPVLRAYLELDLPDTAERLIMQDLLETGRRGLPPADLYIHLTGESHEILARVIRRGRTMEGQVSLARINALICQIEQQLSRVESRQPILRLDISQLEGLLTPEQLAPVIRQIHTRLLTSVNSRPAFVAEMAD